MKQGVIYQIRNVTNGKVYVGSTDTFARRVGQHRSRLIGGKHHSKHLQSAWNKHGADAFVFEVVDEDVDLRFLVSREQMWIDLMAACIPSHGYNKARVGEHPGSPHTEQSKRAMSAARKGVVTERRREAIAKMVASNKGRRHTPERIEKIRQANLRLGRKVPEEQRDAMRRLHTGRKHTMEARAKITAAGIGRKPSEVALAKMSARWKDKPKPRDQVEKQIAATKGRLLGAERYNAKGVAQYDLDGNLIATYEAGAVAARATGVSNSSISAVTRGKHAHAGGFVWRSILA